MKLRRVGLPEVKTKKDSSRPQCYVYICVYPIHQSQNSLPRRWHHGGHISSWTTFAGTFATLSNVIVLWVVQGLPTRKGNHALAEALYCVKAGNQIFHPQSLGTEVTWLLIQAVLNLFMGLSQKLRTSALWCIVVLSTFCYCQDPSHCKIELCIPLYAVRAVICSTFMCRSHHCCYNDKPHQVILFLSLLDSGTRYLINVPFLLCHLVSWFYFH